MSESETIDARGKAPDPALLADCVHCGFCLPACPTYALWGEEMDSPRGRVLLMDLGRRGDIPIDEVFVRHMDACLGCMACVPACPSGVRYHQLIESTRGMIEAVHTRPRSDRAFRWLVFTLFPHPRRLRLALTLAWAYQRSGLRRMLRRSGVDARMPARLQALERLLPDVDLAETRRRLPDFVRAQGRARLRVALLTGCVQQVLFSDVNAATVRVLAAEGCDVVVPPDQRCCGALMLHAGRDDQARAHARDLIEVMERARADVVVVNAAGCGSTLKEYGHLLADEPGWAERAADFSRRVRDITELVADLEPQAPRHPLHARVAYHDACHLGNAQGIRDQPRAVLRAIPGLEVVDLADPEMCCGSAGIYNLVEPEAAEALGRRKAENVRAAGADALATANPGCLLQLQRHLPEGLPMFHPVSLLDASIRGENPLADGDHSQASASLTGGGEQ